jgi:hypothetical protein
MLRGSTPAVVGLVFLLGACGVQSGSADPITNIYSTGFELSEGFDTSFTLIGQDGWTGTDVNGNGIVTNFFVNTTPQLPFGQQQAFVGFYPLTNADGILNVWRPLDFDAVAAGMSIVTFSVTLGIYDSSATTNRDCFRWSVYNAASSTNDGQRLFTLDFDNMTRNINYKLDDDNADFVPTGYAFERSGEEDRHYDLVVTMNFTDNLWSAWLNETNIVTSKPITTQGSALNLGDIDAVWVNREIGVYGDNYMVFDNYSVTAEPYPFWLDPVERLKDGAFLLQLTGEPARKYALDVTTDFVDWSALKTNSADVDGKLVFLDETATNYSRSFYRARLVL